MNDTIQTWWPIVLSITTVVIAFAVYWVRNTAKIETESACGKLDTRLDEHHDRISKLESSIDSLPKKDDIHALAMSQAELLGEMKAMRAKVDGMQDTASQTQASVRRINDY